MYLLSVALDKNVCAAPGSAPSRLPESGPPLLLSAGGPGGGGTPPAGGGRVSAGRVSGVLFVRQPEALPSPTPWERTGPPQKHRK